MNYFFFHLTKNNIILGRGYTIIIIDVAFL